MKQALILLFVLTSAIRVFAQEDTVFIQRNGNWDGVGYKYQVDTVVFNSQINNAVLYGTTVLPSTHNQIEVIGTYGLTLDHISKSDCQNHGEEVYTNDDKINSITETDSTLEIDITVYDNCCYDFLCDVEKDKAGNLNLIYYGYASTYCGCDCCYGMVYHFRKEDFDDLETVLTLTINGNPKTSMALQKCAH